MFAKLLVSESHMIHSTQYRLTRYFQIAFNLLKYGMSFRCNNGMSVEYNGAIENIELKCRIRALYNEFSVMDYLNIFKFRDKILSSHVTTRMISWMKIIFLK